ncbi:BTAD domain-containing putative transcriptional regulator [Actinotalea sp. Marseille-Q4924]|uniref:nSTAND1 domain-containing NTPase n=1 Tax=Actinotalea sp. Marseille-Q4924 TaxID=2866571 RepID=UPI001CE443D9|nr:BTAD domain-containing putative transcriptional regulator [Actinotalea sp. Marseille-Q4924]
MHVSVLGTMRVSVGDGTVEVPGRRERTLLARLVASVGHMVPTDDLVDALWGDDPPRTAAKSLQTVVLRLRDAIEPERGRPPRLLVTDGPGYRLTLDPSAIDAERFLRLVTQAREAMAGGRPAAAARMLREALGMWHGPAYADVRGTAFGQAEGRRLDEARLTATEDLWAAEIDGGDLPAAARELERFVADHPHRERAWELLMLAQYRLGQQADALRTYERVRDVLAEDLGVDPGAALRRRHQQVLTQDPELGGPPPSDVVPPRLREPATPLRGREQELAALRRAWGVAEDGGSAHVVLTGPPGAGTGRLVQALATEVLDRGGHVREAGAGPATPMGDGTPALVVARGPVTGPLAPATLLVQLCRPHEVPTSAAHVVELGPLGADDVVAMLADRLGPQTAPAAAEHVLERSGGWPGRVEAATVSWNRAQAAVSVRDASLRASASAAELADARSSLVDGVQTLAESGAPGHEDGVCPWRGLEAYAVDDARWFCGRERLTAELLARIAGSRALAVVGPSGSGKSSVIRAGLLAGLREDLLPGSGRWRQVVVQPGAHPMRALAEAAVGQPGVAVEDAIGSLFRSQEGPERVVLVVDQLEEAWTACHDVGERTAFLDTLAALPAGDAGITLVVAVRADLVGQLAEHADMARVVGDATVLVGPPSPEEIRRAVELPARRAGLDLEVGLADALVADAGREPGLLPLLSTSLTQLWHMRRGRTLTLAAYVGTGGLSGAIAHQAETAMQALPENVHPLAQTLFLRLAGPGEGDLVTRRRVPLKELLDLGRPGMADLVDTLARARLLTVSDGHVEVSHEALFREWPRLRAWLEDDTAGRAVQRRLAVAAGEWDDEHRDPSLLWTGTRLAAGLEVAQHRPEEVTGVEREFLDAARDQLDRDRVEAERRAQDALSRNRRLRLVVVGLACVLVVALLAGVVAWQAELRSRRAQAEALAAQSRAEEAAVTATAGRLAATAVNEDYYDRALLLALEAVDRAPTPDTYGPLLTLLGQAPDLRTQVRTEERFLRVDAGEDGGTVYVGENAPRVWAVDAATGARLWTADLPVQALGLDAGPGGVLVSGPSDDGSGVALLDPATGAQRWFVDEPALRGVLEPGADPVVSPFVSWTPDGLVLVVTPTHLVYLTAGGGLEHAVPLPRPQWPDFVHLFPDGRVSMASEDGGSLVIDPAHPEREPARLSGHVWHSTPDGLLLVGEDLASAQDDVVYTVYDAATLQPVSAPIGVDASRTGLLSADGATLYAGEENVVVVVDVASGERVGTHRAHSGTVMGLALAGPDDDVLWSAGRDGAAIAWDLTGRSGLLDVQRGVASVVKGHTAAATGVGLAQAFDGDEPGFGALHVVDLPRGQVLVEDLPPPASAEPFVWTTGVSRDGTTGVAAWGTGDDPYAAPTVLAVYALPSGSLRTQVDLPGPVLGIAVSDDGSRAVVVGRDERAVVDLTTGRVVATQRSEELERYPDTAGLAALSPDGTTVLVATPGGVAVLDSSTAEELAAAALPGEDEAVSLEWAADGRTVLVGSSQGRVHVLDAGTLAPRSPARIVSPGWVLDLAVSPAGDVAASLGTDGDLLLWDVATWQPLGRPVSDGTMWGWLGFDPERPVLHSWSEQGVVVRVSTAPRDWVAAACAAANRELTDTERQIHLREDARGASPRCEGTGARS